VTLEAGSDDSSFLERHKRTVGKRRWRRYILPEMFIHLNATSFSLGLHESTHALRQNLLEYLYKLPNLVLRIVVHHAHAHHALRRQP
jgi:hypothetical protein